MSVLLKSAMDLKLQKCLQEECKDDNAILDLIQDKGKAQQTVMQNFGLIRQNNSN